MLAKQNFQIDMPVFKTVEKHFPVQFTQIRPVVSFQNSHLYVFLLSITSSMFSCELKQVPCVQDCTSLAPAPAMKCPLTFAQAEESQTLLAKLYQALQFIDLGVGIAEPLRSLTVKAVFR